METKLVNNSSLKLLKDSASSFYSIAEKVVLKQSLNDVYTIPHFALVVVV